MNPESFPSLMGHIGLWLMAIGWTLFGGFQIYLNNLAGGVPLVIGGCLAAGGLLMRKDEVKPNITVGVKPDEEPHPMLVDDALRGNRKQGQGRVWRSHMTQDGLWYVIHEDDTVAPYWHCEMEPTEILKEPLFPIG